MARATEHGTNGRFTSSNELSTKENARINRRIDHAVWPFVVANTDLTLRDRQMLYGWLQHGSIEQIGLALGIVPATVKNHFGAIRKRLDVETTYQAVALAVARGIIPIYTLTEAAAEAGVTPGAIRRAIRAGFVETMKGPVPGQPNRWRWYLDAAALDHYQRYHRSVGSVPRWMIAEDPDHFGYLLARNAARPQPAVPPRLPDGRFVPGGRLTPRRPRPRRPEPPDRPG